MLKLTLSILRLFRPFFIRMGINYNQMQAIVSTKLTIDNRIDRTWKSKGMSNHTLVKQAVFMSLIGCCLFLASYRSQSPYTAFLVFHSYLSIVVISGFMTEYARLLFDNKDNSIIERFPVNSRTFLSARIISMLSYLYLVTFSLSALPYVILIFTRGFIEAQFFMVGTVINTLFSLLLANVLYIGLMRYVSAEKFRKITTWLQTLLITGIVIGYQFTGKITPGTIDLSQAPSFWLFLIPPAYFVSFSALYDQPGVFPALLSGTGLLATLLLLFLTLFYFSDAYMQKASSIDQVRPSQQSHKERIPLFFSRLFCREMSQHCGFFLTWRLTRDNFKFKQSIFLMLVYTLILNAIPLYNLYQQQGEIRIASLLFPLYMLPLVGTGVIMNINYTEQNNLLWIYQSRPVPNPGALLLGSLKAIYFKYFFPLLVTLCVLYNIICGWSILDDLFLVFSFSTLFLFIFYCFSAPVFPFSKERNTRESGSALLKTFGTMFLLFLMGAVHFLLLPVPYGTWGAISLSWLFIYLLARKIKKLSFRKIEARYGI